MHSKLPCKATVTALNYHWEFQRITSYKINHQYFVKYFVRIPDLETKERICTQYRHNNLVFTVYASETYIKVTGCTRDISKVLEIVKTFDFALHDITEWNTK